MKDAFDDYLSDLLGEKEQQDKEEEPVKKKPKDKFDSYLDDLLDTSKPAEATPEKVETAGIGVGSSWKDRTRAQLKEASREVADSNQIGDLDVDLAKGVGQVAQFGAGALQMLDPSRLVVQDGLVRKGLDKVGYDPQAIDKYLSSFYTDERKDIEEEYNKAEGFLDSAEVLIKNPKLILGRAVQSAPGMAGSGVVASFFAARAGAVVTLAGARAGLSPGVITAAAKEAATRAGILAGAVSEGVQQTGSSFHDLVKETDSDLVAYAAALGSGVGTAVISLLSGKIGGKLGIGDIETGQAGTGSFAKRIIGGVIKEGPFEEGLQSSQEAAWENWAKDQPLGAGVGKAFAEGSLVGGLVGGVSNLNTASAGAPPAPPTETTGTGGAARPTTPANLDVAAGLKVETNPDAFASGSDTADAVAAKQQERDNLVLKAVRESEAQRAQAEQQAKEAQAQKEAQEQQVQAQQAQAVAREKQLAEDVQSVNDAMVDETTTLRLTSNILAESKKNKTRKEFVAAVAPVHQALALPTDMDDFRALEKLRYKLNDYGFNTNDPMERVVISNLDMYLQDRITEARKPEQMDVPRGTRKPELLPSEAEGKNLGQGLFVSPDDRTPGGKNSMLEDIQGRPTTVTQPIRPERVEQEINRDTVESRAGSAFRRYLDRTAEKPVDTGVPKTKLPERGSLIGPKETLVSATVEKPLSTEIPRTAAQIKSDLVDRAGKTTPEQDTRVLVTDRRAYAGKQGAAAAVAMKEELAERERVGKRQAQERAQKAAATKAVAKQAQEAQEAQESQEKSGILRTEILLRGSVIQGETVIGSSKKMGYTRRDAAEDAAKKLSKKTGASFAIREYRTGFYLSPTESTGVTTAPTVYKNRDSAERAIRKFHSPFTHTTVENKDGSYSVEEKPPREQGVKRYSKVPAPKKTITAYKLFKTLKNFPGKLFPLFIGTKKDTPQNEWIAGEFIPTKGFANRPGWHAGILPVAPHLRQRKTGRINPQRVWAEVEMPDDVNWQSTADLSKKGDIRDRVPEGGHYKFKTSKMQGSSWIIGGAIKINKILSDNDVATILKENGYSSDEISRELKDPRTVKFSKGTVTVESTPDQVQKTKSTITDLYDMSARIPRNFAFIESVDDIPTEHQSRDGSAIEAYWDEDTDTVYYVLPNISPDRAVKVWLHENIGHRGLRNFLNQAGVDFDQFLDDVYKKVKSTAPHLVDEVRAEYGDQLTGLPEQEQARIIAEEIVARRSERLNPFVRKSVFTKLYELINKLVSALTGGKYKLTMGDIDTILEGAKNYVVSGEVIKNSVVNNYASATKLAKTKKWKNLPEWVGALQDAVKKQIQISGKDLSVDTLENRTYLARALVKEVEHLMTNVGGFVKKAVGWYDKTTRTALGVLSLVHPEINTDPHSRFVFTVLLALSSNQTEVKENIVNAERAYEYYKKNGTLPTPKSVLRFGNGTDAVYSGLVKFQSMVDKFGMDTLLRMCQTDFTVGELASISPDLKPATLNTDTVVRGSAFMGPKVGQGFFSNLYGYFDALTIDVWGMRTWGRLTGQLIDINEKSIKVSYDRLSKTIEDIQKDPELVKAFTKIAGPKIQLAWDDPSALSKQIWKITTIPSFRAELSATDLGNELRMAARDLFVKERGLVETIRNGSEYTYINGVFKKVLQTLQRKPEFKELTMADLQAMFWYGEKALYDAAGIKKALKRDKEGNVILPDFAEAAKVLAREKGISQELIDDTVQRIENEPRGTRPVQSTDDTVSPEQQENLGGFTKAERKQFLKEQVTKIRKRRGLKKYSLATSTNNPEMGMGVHWMNTQLADGEFIRATPYAEEGNREYGSYSRDDIGNRMASKSRNGEFDYFPLVYFYETDTAPERQLRAKKNKYIADFSKSRIYDFTTDPLGIGKKAQEIKQNDPGADLTNIKAHLLNDQGFDGFVTWAPTGSDRFGKNGRWILMLHDQAVQQGTISATVGISDVVERIETDLPQELVEASKLVHQRTEQFTKRIKEILKNYPEVTLEANDPTIARFEGATSGKLELSTAVDLRGPRSAMRAMLAEAGIETGQRNIFLMHKEGTPTGRLVRFRAKREFTSAVQIGDVLQKNNVTEFNITERGGGFYISRFFPFDEEGNISGDINAFSTAHDELADKSWIRGVVNEDVNSEVLGDNTWSDDIDAALPGYQNDLVEYFGKVKGNVIYDRAIQKRQEYLNQLTERVGRKAETGGVQDGTTTGQLDRSNSGTTKEIADGVEVWHGAVKKLTGTPTLDAVGSGTGQAVYGWGFNLSEEKETASGYSKDDNLYNLVIPKDVASRIVDWKGNLGDKLAKQINTALAERGVTLGGELLAFDSNDVVQNAYDDIAMAIRSKRSAAEFFASLGIPGHKYYTTEGKKSNKANYVIWDQTALDKIVEKRAVDEQAATSSKTDSRIRYSKVIPDSKVNVRETPNGIVAHVAAFVDTVKQWGSSRIDDIFGSGTFVDRNIDRFNPVRLMEKTSGAPIAPSMSGYKALRLMTSLGSIMGTLVNEGHLEYDNTSHSIKLGNTKEGGLLKVFEGMSSNDIEMTKVRLVAERVDQLLKSGTLDQKILDRIYGDDDSGVIDPVAHTAYLLGQTDSWKNNNQALWSKVTKHLDAYNKSVLDLAVSSGIVSKEKANEWKNFVTYVPLNRLMVDDETVQSSGVWGSPGRVAGPKAFKGSGGYQIGDPLDNLILNYSYLVNESLKNLAFKKVYAQAKQAGLMTHKIMSRADAMQRVKKDIIIVRVDGKEQYIQVDDGRLFSALADMDTPALSVPILSAAKRALTWGATLSPAFRFRNIIRDTMHTAILLGSADMGSVASSFIDVMGKDKDMALLRSLGGAFTGSFYSADTPQNVQNAVDAGIKKDTVLRKALGMWEKVGEAAENANRLATFRKLKKAGMSDFDAAFEAKDLLDFSMYGNSKLSKFLISIVPFLNARIQGLYKLNREIVSNDSGNRNKILVRGAAVSVASILLHLLNLGAEDEDDEEKYSNIPNEDKWNYWHFKFGGTHLALPKPFELGAVFGELPVRLFDIAFRATFGKGGLKDSQKELGQFMAFSALQTFSLNPAQNPLLGVPLEQAANYDFFTGRPVVGPELEGVLPVDQWDKNTSKLAKLIGGKIGFSPKRIDHIIHKSMAFAGDASVAMFDHVVAPWIKAFPNDPAMTIDDMYWLHGKIYREKTRYIKQQGEFYQLASDIDNVMNSYTKRIERGERAEARELKRDNRWAWKTSALASSAKSQLSALKDKEDRVFKSTSLSPEDKQERLDAIVDQRHRIIVQAVKKIKQRKDTGEE